MKGDLHCHTTLSDGSLGIEEVIVQAKRTGIDVLAITDHDTLSSSSRAQILGERYGVTVVPAVELSAWDKKRNRKVHILCYAPQKPDRLEGLCLKSCEIRRMCANEMIQKVMELYPITPEAVIKYSKGSKSVFKQHIMRALVNYGYATDLYGGLNHRLFNPKNGICLVTREYPDVNYVCELIHSSRGIAVMAHPLMFDNLELAEELAESGKLDGIEVHHYSSDDEDKKASLLAVAEKYNLLVTGGSDFHGLYNRRPTHIGSRTTDQANLDRLFKMMNANTQK